MRGDFVCEVVCFDCRYETEIVEQAIRAGRCEGGQFLATGQAANEAVVSLLSRRDALGPLPVVVLVADGCAAAGGVEAKVLAVVIPAAEKMLVGLGEMQRATEPAADSTIQDRHRHARAAEAGQDAVNEQIPRIAGVVIAFEEREVVRDADVALQALGQCNHAKTRFTVLEAIRIVLETMKQMLGVTSNQNGPIIDLLEAVAEKRIVRPGQVRCAPAS